MIRVVPYKLQSYNKSYSKRKKSINKYPLLYANANFWTTPPTQYNEDWASTLALIFYSLIN